MTEAKKRPVSRGRPKKGQSEGDYRRAMLARLKREGVWFCRIEAAMGGTAGNPDLLVLIEGTLIPIELKVGAMTGFSLRPLKPLEPSQWKWHIDLARRGGFSFMLIGVPSVDGWTSYPVDIANSPLGAHAFHRQREFKLMREAFRLREERRMADPVFRSNINLDTTKA